LIGFASSTTDINRTNLHQRNGWACEKVVLSVFFLRKKKYIGFLQCRSYKNYANVSADSQRFVISVLWLTLTIFLLGYDHLLVLGLVSLKGRFSGLVVELNSSLLI
jgi:hypothetical protein